MSENVVSLEKVRDKKKAVYNITALRSFFQDKEKEALDEYNEAILKYRSAHTLVNLLEAIVTHYLLGEYDALDDVIKHVIETNKDVIVVTQVARRLYSVKDRLRLYENLLEHLDSLCGPLSITEAREQLKGLVGEYIADATPQHYKSWDLLSYADKHFR